MEYRNYKFTSLQKVMNSHSTSATSNTMYDGNAPAQAWIRP